MKFPWLKIAIILVVCFILIKGGLMIGLGGLFVSSLDLNQVDAQTNETLKQQDPIAIPNNKADLDALNPEIIAAQRREAQTDFNIFSAPSDRAKSFLGGDEGVKISDSKELTPPRSTIPAETDDDIGITKDNVEKAPSGKFLSFKEQEIFLSILRDNISKKEADLQKKQENLEALLKRYDLENNNENLRMVELYSQMKAKAAAEIFNELDLETLVPIARGMIPRKLAPILAEMSPQKATELSRQLAGSNSQIDLLRKEVELIKEERSQLKTTLANEKTANPEDNQSETNPLGTIVPNN